MALILIDIITRKGSKIEMNKYKKISRGLKFHIEKPLSELIVDFLNEQIFLLIE